MGGVASSFQENLRVGQIGESLIAAWLKSRGNSVLPVYEVEIDTGKGPRVFSPSGQIVAPDMFVFNGERGLWIEAKHKSRFSWYGKGKTFCTGIDYRHFVDYCKVDDISPFPVWLFFLHKRSDTWAPDVEKWGAPSTCPTGLFVGKLSELRNNYRPDERLHMTKRGLVYWNVDQLTKMAELPEVLAATSPSRITAMY